MNVGRTSMEKIIRSMMPRCFAARSGKRRNVRDTARFLVAFIASLVITLLVMPGVIRYLHKIKFGQTEREEGLASHKVKNGTPTMGGLVFIIVPVLVFAILQLDALRQNNIQIVILAYLGYGLIGFIDDYLIVVKKNNDGLKPGVKFAHAVCIGGCLLFIVSSICFYRDHDTDIGYSF